MAAPPVASERPSFPWRLILLFGAAAGLAIASKHSAVLVVAPLLIALIALSRNNSPGLVQLGAAGAVIVVIFLALNPAWWSAPFSAASETLRLRAELMKMQTSVFGGYAGFGASANGFARYAILETPQYFEFPSWQEIGPTIAAYQASPWVLTPMLNTIRALVTAALAVLGIVVLARRRDAVAGVAGAWIIVAIGGTAMLTTLPWARYYLPALPAIYALAAVGAGLLTRH
jgi:4-amino-4-deoxy-L-arabinose transferase-like glycosyltransferase